MLINKPTKYEEVEVNLDYTPLELGGHKGIIKTVEEYVSEYSGKTSLKVTVDTALDDKQPSYFQQQYDSNTNTDKKWANGATKYVSLSEEENCVKMLKGFITAIENSNPGFVYDWSKDTNQLVGKKVGLVFGLEEYDSGEGIKLATKLNQFRSIDKVSNAQIPKVKTLNFGFVDYDDYMENREENESQKVNEAVSVLVDDSELPF